VNQFRVQSFKTENFTGESTFSCNASIDWQSDIKPKEVQKPVCKRPDSGCEADGLIYQTAECDGDGILDHVCTDSKTGETKVVLSMTGCFGYWSQAQSDKLDDVCHALRGIQLEENVKAKQVIPSADMVSWFKMEDFEDSSKDWKSAVGDHVGKATGDVKTQCDGVAQNGASKPVCYVKGASNTKYHFGPVIKQEFSICSVTRYAGNAKGMILMGNPSVYWFQGHWYHRAGVAYYSGWKTYWNQLKDNNDWVVMCTSNAGEAKYNIYLNGNVFRAYNDFIGVGNQELQINYGRQSHDLSDWAVMEVVTWSRGLKDEEMKKAMVYLMSRLSGDAWQSFDGKLYKYISTAMSFSAAQSTCASQGGSLVSISSDKENKFVGDLLPVTENLWAWIGNPAKGGAYTNFLNGRPNILGKACVRMFSKVWGNQYQKWDDQPCSDSGGFVCSKDEEGGDKASQRATYEIVKADESCSEAGMEEVESSEECMVAGLATGMQESMVSGGKVHVMDPTADNPRGCYTNTPAGDPFNNEYWLYYAGTSAHRREKQKTRGGNDEKKKKKKVGPSCS